MQEENKKVFGPQATLPLTAKGGLRWIHTNRPAAMYGKTHATGNQLRHTARRQYWPAGDPGWTVIAVGVAPTA